MLTILMLVLLLVGVYLIAGLIALSEDLNDLLSGKEGEMGLDED